MAQLERRIRQLNALLAAELGSADGVHALFEWHWSEDLRAAAPAENANGEAIYDRRCTCGTNASVHLSGCVLEIAQQRFEVVQLAPTIRRRWVICRWVAPPPLANWVQAFGSEGNYPANGTYVPLMANSQPLALNPGLEPDERLTRAVIQTIKSQHSVREMLERYREAQAKQDERAVFGPNGELIHRPGPGTDWARTRDQVRDKMTTFGQVPGSRASHVSYPGTAASIVPAHEFTRPPSGTERNN